MDWHPIPASRRNKGVTMNRKLSPLFWGILLIVIGTLILLQTLDVLRFAVAIVWSLLFGLAGIGFLSVYASERQHWWALIPGFVLLAIGTIILLGEIAPAVGNVLSGPLVVGAIAVSFLLIFALHPGFWWALIPGGVMASVTLVTLIDAFNLPIDGGVVILLGIGLTFVLLSLVRTEKGERMWWALIPGGVMLLIGLFVAAQQVALAGYVLPAVLLAVGIYFIFRGLRASGPPPSSPPRGRYD
jgi:hypothetical protein